MDPYSSFKYKILLEEFQNKKYLPSDQFPKEYYLKILDSKVRIFIFFFEFAFKRLIMEDSIVESQNKFLKEFLKAATIII